ncbi:MAG: myo-inositol catabolism protein [Chitinivibrionales bacterium]|nr:myo-inositol catabolism protein [Chitinivibrionales bacterium]
MPNINGNSHNPETWKIETPTAQGLHTIVTPEHSDLAALHFFRCNLNEYETIKLTNATLEMSGVVISGSLEIDYNEITTSLKQFDAFYLPASEVAEIQAQSATIIYLAGAPFEEVGSYHVRQFDPDLPVGNIHQIHGKPPYERHVHMALDQDTPASRLITGITFGDDGAWTSWPPHQHEANLEEIYCYFDIPKPNFALHLSYRKPGQIENIFPVSSGDCVLIPSGYHPTLAIPGAKSTYFWAMAAFSKDQRSYDLAVPDPSFG